MVRSAGRTLSWIAAASVDGRFGLSRRLAPRLGGACLRRATALQRAATDAKRVALGERGDAMSHAWLVTGPPGSGRSTLALAFAAAFA